MSAGPATAVTAYVGLGANLGDPVLQLRRAIAALAQLPDTSVTAQSSLFHSAPVDAGGDDYVNAVVQLTTRLPAAELLAHLQALEQAGGRERPYRNAPRTLDLDILLYGQQQIASEQLTIPHPRLTQRAFALIPLLQLDPLLAIPGQGPAHSFAPAVAAQAIQKIGDEY